MYASQDITIYILFSSIRQEFCHSILRRKLGLDFLKNLNLYENWETIKYSNIDSFHTKCM